MFNVVFNLHMPFLMPYDYWSWRANRNDVFLQTQLIQALPWQERFSFIAANTKTPGALVSVARQLEAAAVRWSTIGTCHHVCMSSGPHRQTPHRPPERQKAMPNGQNGSSFHTWRVWTFANQRHVDVMTPRTIYDIYIYVYIYMYIYIWCTVYWSIFYQSMGLLPLPVSIVFMLPLVWRL